MTCRSTLNSSPHRYSDDAGETRPADARRVRRFADLIQPGQPRGGLSHPIGGAINVAVTELKIFTQPTTAPGASEHSGREVSPTVGLMITPLPAGIAVAGVF